MRLVAQALIILMVTNSISGAAWGAGELMECYAATPVQPLDPASPDFQPKSPDIKTERNEMERFVNRPVAPPQMSPTSTVTPFGCNRQFVYIGRYFALDSYYRRDGEGLRPLMQEIPDAISEVDRYQDNRLTSKKFAYIGTIGLTIAIASVFVRKFGNDTTESIHHIAFPAGLIIGGGSFLYSFGLLFANESHLSKAVDIHNASRPNTPIELKVGAVIPLSF